MKKKTENQTETLAKSICEFLSSKKGEDIVLIDVREKTSLCDYFIVASGRSTQQVKALCENLEDKLSAEGLEPKRTGGRARRAVGRSRLRRRHRARVQRRIAALLSSRTAVGRRRKRRPLRRLVAEFDAFGRAVVSLARRVRFFSTI